MDSIAGQSDFEEAYRVAFDAAQELQKATMRARFAKYKAEYADRDKRVVALEDEPWVTEFDRLIGDSRELASDTFLAIKGVTRLVRLWTFWALQDAGDREFNGLGEGYNVFYGTMADNLDQMVEDAQTIQGTIDRKDDPHFLQALIAELAEALSGEEGNGTDADHDKIRYLNSQLRLLNARLEEEVMGFDDFEGGKDAVEALTVRAYKLAKEYAVAGVTPYYIPALKRPSFEGFGDQTAVSVIDAHGEEIVTGDGVDVVFTAQSAIKPFLFLYALYKNAHRTDIAGFEPTANPFNYDLSLDYTRHAETAEHGAINSGAISAAGEIEDFNDFLNFMRVLTGKEDLAVNEEVYKSEKRESGGNRALTHSLHKRGRFVNQLQAERAVDNYIRACALDVTASDLAKAYNVLATGGKKEDKQIIPKDLIVPVINALGSFGLYDKHWEITEMVAGGTMLSAKTGVGGVFVNIMPGGLVIVTWSPQLDAAGNSVFGTLFHTLTNRYYANNAGMLRYGPKNTDEAIANYMADVKAFAMSELANGVDPRLVKIPNDDVTAGQAAALSQVLGTLAARGIPASEVVAALSDEERAALVAVL